MIYSFFFSNPLFSLLEFLQHFLHKIMLIPAIIRSNGITNNKKTNPSRPADSDG